MKVPVYDTPEAHAQPLEPATSNLNFGGLNDGLIQGLNQVGQHAQQAYELAKASSEKADVQAVTDAETAYQATENERLHDPQNGLMNKRGQAAFEDSTQAVEDLQQAAKDTGDALLQNDRQRKLYQMRMGGRLEEAHKQIETFAGQQRLAGQEASLKAGQEQALTKIANSYADPDVVARQTAAMEGPLRALALSKDDGDAKVAQWQQQVVKTRLNQYVAAQDYKGAQALFAQEKDKLGPEAGQYLHTITTGNNALQSDIQASAVLKDAVVPGYPWMDKGKALAAVEALPPGPLKDETAKRVEHQLAQNESLKKEAAKDHMDLLLSVYGKTKNPYDPAIAPIKAWMLDPQNGAAGEWEKWERELRADSRASHVSDAEERRAETERQKVLLDTFRGMDVADKAKANIDQVFLGDGASDLTKAQMRIVQQAAKKEMQQNGGVKADEFKRDILAEAENAGVTQKLQVEAFKGKMDAWRSRYLEDSNGKNPTREEVTKAIAAALLRGNDGSWWANDRYRFQFKDTEKFEALPLEKQKSPLNRTPTPAAPALPAERTVNGTRYVLNPATGKYRKAE